MTVQKYRKKPVVIDAMPYTGTYESAKSVIDWVREHGQQAIAGDSSSGRWLKIVTLEGHMDASAGDYIIKGVQGEFYPCKPGIFSETYEEASN
jgi:hypothetical protein